MPLDMTPPDHPTDDYAAARARLAAAFGDPSSAAMTLLDWYDRNARELPWRTPPGSSQRPDDYHVWLSEIMLQQTTVATVKGYFDRFLSRWPTVKDLAAAPLDDVLHAWQGLGYYARARNLHKCAQTVARDFNGRFPHTEEGLRALPGIGAYTAAAIAAIAFDRRAVVVDGNVERVMARLHAVETPLPVSKPTLKELAALTTPDDRAGDYAQAVMDLGATVCTPRSPSCLLCPWKAACAAANAGIAETLPRKTPKKAKPTRRGIVWWIQNDDGHVLLRRRLESGLLGGMMEFPGTEWSERAAGPPPVDLTEQKTVGTVSHVFTHFRLELEVRVARTRSRVDEMVWTKPEKLDDHALPTLMKKVARVALSSEAVKAP